MPLPSISGLTVWLDASQLTSHADNAALSPWPDLSGNGRDGIIGGTPAPVVRTHALNGMRVVRFRVGEGRVRGNSGIVNGTVTGKNFSIFIVCRMLGPVPGRIFTSDYPTGNLALGHHASGEDAVLEGGVGWIPAAPAAYTYLPTPWKIQNYMSAHGGSSIATAYYLNGVYKGGTNDLAAEGLQHKYCLSGYGTGTAESADCEVAEMLIYNRRLEESERIQVHDYLWAKWGLNTQPRFNPVRDMVGVNVWLDASKEGNPNGTTMAAWPDWSGNANNATAFGTVTIVKPLLDNKPVMRYTAGGGYMIGDTGLAGGTPGYNFSVFHMSRVRGPGVNGRMFSGQPNNFLLGSHGAGYDACFDNGWLTYTAWGAATSTPWKIYGYTAYSPDAVAYEGKFFINGVQIGATKTTIGAGLDASYVLNNFNAGVEYGDIDIAEVLLYNRKLVAQEVARVNEYLDAKWHNRIPSNCKNNLTVTGGSYDGGTGWYSGDVTMTYGYSGPDGSSTATRVVANTATGGHSFYWNYPHADNTWVTYSIYAKAFGLTSFMVYWHDTGDWSNFVLTGAGSVSNGGTATSTIEWVRNGWYRCTSTVKKVGAVNPAISNYIIFSGAGNNVDGLYFWGAELVKSRYPSPNMFVSVVGAIAASGSTPVGEGAPSNLITQPYSFDSSLWVKENVTVVADPLTPLLFKPTDIVGLNVWFEASFVTYQDNNPATGMSNWMDLTGNARHSNAWGTPLTARGMLVPNALNNRSVIRQSSGAWHTGNTGLPASGRAARNFSAFYVARVVGPISGRVLGSTPNPMHFGFSDSAQDVLYDGGWLNSGNSYGTLPTPWRLWGYIGLDDGTTYSGSFRRNGTVLTTVPSNSAGTGMAGQYQLGINGAGADCQIAEVLIYNRALSSTEIAQVEAYLRVKWGLY